MKKYIITTLYAIFCFLAIGAYADEKKEALSIGLKGGTFSIGYENSLNIFSFGGTIGYLLPVEIGSFRMGFEGDFNMGLFGGDYVSGYPGDKSHIRTFGAYAVVSTIPSNDIYFKGKLGVTHETVLETIRDLETPYGEIGPAFGIGAGFKADDNLNMELEFTTTHSDMKFFSVCIKFIL